MKSSAKSSYDPRAIVPADEFGGPWGTFGIIAFSHFIVLYLYYCLKTAKGSLVIPATLTEALYLFPTMARAAATDGSLSFAIVAYTTFLVLQAVFYCVMPGVIVRGRPLPGSGAQLTYQCNGVASFWATNALMVVLHYTGVFNMGSIIDNLGAFIVVAMAAGDIVSALLYLIAASTNEAERMSGSVVYDYFMGAWLNPRIGVLDVKLLFETRFAWIMLFYITASAAVKQFAETGSVSTPMAFMLTAHFLYVNACMKGEECVPSTWDMFHEKLGWMLVFWNMCGVPLAYCFQSVFIYRNNVQHEPLYMAALFVVLLAAYFVFDTTNSQKNRFRMMDEGTYIPRKAFPQLPFGTLINPTFIQTKQGNKLLTGGWYGVTGCRKIHYTADIVMALTWGLSCGLTHFLPFYYVCFFASFLAFREQRDFRRCADKYGDDWKLYTWQVPYAFIPGVY